MAPGHREKLHQEALISALLLIDPSLARRKLLPLSTPIKSFDFIRLFRAEIDGLLIRPDPRAPALRRRVQSFLEEALTAWPAVFAHYCLAEAAVAADLPRLQIPLGRAARFATTADELHAIARAQAQVTQLMRERLHVTPSRPPPTAANAATAGAAVMPPVAEPAARPIHFTRRQRGIFEHCCALGELFYRHRQKSPGPVEPRLFPLLCAPTGAGKTRLVALVAARLGAHCLRVQRGDLAPQGAAKMRATTFAILDALVLHERLLLHLDELDKFTTGHAAPTPSTEWGAGIFSDLWSLLDGVLPCVNYLASEDRVRPPGVTVTEAWLQQRVRTGLFIVGSGTWQSVFAAAQRPTLGFGGTNAATRVEVRAEDIVAAGLISVELLARFSSDIMIMNYAEPDEVQTLLEATGILALARSCTYTITAEDLDFRRGGFRVIETLYSRLLLLQHRQSGGPGLGAEPGKAAAISSPANALAAP